MRYDLHEVCDYPEYAQSMVCEGDDPVKPGTFVDVMSDFGFKRILGSPGHEKFLIHFLNQLLDGRKVIIDLEYTRNERQGVEYQSRKSIFDVTCKGSDGTQFLIEVQRIKQPHFTDRMLYYASCMITDQSIPSDWNYELQEVYVIAIMDFNFPEWSSEGFYHNFKIQSDDGKLSLTKKLEFIFLEVPKFNKISRRLTTDMDRWMYIFKNLGQLRRIPVTLARGIFNEILPLAAVSKFSKTELMNYNASLKAQRDEYANREMMHKKAIKARQEGFQSGKVEMLQSIMTSGNFTPAELAERTGWDEAEILETLNKQH